MRKLLVILGPTATGKTDLGLQLAKKFNGELVSADSRQVYKDLDIGTGKSPSGISNFQFPISKNKNYWETNGIKIWMYDVVGFKKQYTVFDFVDTARKIIDDIRKKGKLPILVGGTGLYIKALLEGLDNLEIKVNKGLRNELGNLSLVKLQDRLKKSSIKKWESLNYSDQQNPRRLIRAIEIREATENKNVGLSPLSDADVLKIGLTAKRETLYQRVDKSVLSRIKQGMLEEVENLHKNGLSLKRMKQLGLEYGVLAGYLEKKIENKEILVKILQGKIHAYVRRQLTWFKKEKDVNWFDVSDKGLGIEVEEIVSIWYDKQDANKN